jgi:hypothetical protein
MAFMTYIFAATEAELDVAFPGWRRPLPEPVPYTFVNPYTKKIVTGTTTDPANIDPSIPKVVPGEEAHDVEEEDDDDEDHSVDVVNWVPPRFRNLALVQIKDLFMWDIDAIVEISAGRLAPRPGQSHKGHNFLSIGDDDPAAQTRPIRYGTRHTIYAFPTAATALFASLATKDLPALGTSMSDGSFFSSRGWSAKMCAGVLGELRAVALEAQRPGRHLCIFMETP